MQSTAYLSHRLANLKTMPRILTRHVPQSPPSSHPKKKFRTVLGLSSISQSSNLATIDTNVASTPKSKRKPRQGSTVTQESFFEATAQNIDSMQVEEMNVEIPSKLPPNAAPIRIGAEDGPWNVSVAETPDDRSSYSIYVKSWYRFTTSPLTLGLISHFAL